MTKDAKTAAKLEKKLRILLGGYQVSIVTTNFVNELKQSCALLLLL